MSLAGSGAVLGAVTGVSCDADAVAETGQRTVRLDAIATALGGGTAESWPLP